MSRVSTSPNRRTRSKYGAAAGGPSFPIVVVDALTGGNFAFSASVTCPLTVANFVNDAAGDIVYEATIVDSSSYPVPTGGGPAWNILATSRPGTNQHYCKLSRSDVLSAPINADVTLSSPPSSSGTGRVAIIVRGANATTPEDVAIGVTSISAHGATQTITGLTTVTANTLDVLIALAGDDNAAGATYFDSSSLVTDGFTIVRNTGSGLGTDTSVLVAYRQQAAIGAQGSTTTTRAAGAVAAHVAVFRLAIRPA